jgi:hypothetical protein
LNAVHETFTTRSIGAESVTALQRAFFQKSFQTGQLMPVPANDNRRIEPFHRLYADGLLHKNKATNASLFFCGERYRSDFEKARTAASASPIQAVDYSRPQVSGGGFSPFKDRPASDRRIDVSRSYHEANERLDALGLREVVESIVVLGNDVVTTGREYSGRRQEQQARSAAITALSIGLRVLQLYYKPPAAKLAA